MRRFRLGLFSLLAALALSGQTLPTAAAGLGEACGGPHRIACSSGLWCEPAPGRCGRRHARGTCVKASPMCIKIWRPVCGCDGKTYGNDCERRSHRVPKRADGHC